MEVSADAYPDRATTRIVKARCRNSRLFRVMPECWGLGSRQGCRYANPRSIAKMPIRQPGCRHGLRKLPALVLPSDSTSDTCRGAARWRSSRTARPPRGRWDRRGSPDPRSALALWRSLRRGRSERLPSSTAPKACDSDLPPGQALKESFVPRWVRGGSGRGAPAETSRGPRGLRDDIVQDLGRLYSLRRALSLSV